MFGKKQKYLALAALLVGSVVFARGGGGGREDNMHKWKKKPVQAATQTDPTTVKSYTLLNLQRVVTNAPECKAYFEDLKQLAKKPITLQFSKNTDKTKGELASNDTSGQISNHTHTTLKQTVNGSAVNRVGMGSFDYKNQTIDYVVEVSGNTANPNHQYLYPAIFSSHNANCYYTALVKPSKETVTAFQKNIQSGAVAKKTDLAK